MKKKGRKKEKRGLPTLGFLIAWGTGNLDKYKEQTKKPDLRWKSRTKNAKVY